MKFAVVTVFAVAAFAHTAFVNAHGVCYDPNHASPVTEGSIIADAKKMKDAGFTSVRIYTPTYGNMNVGDLITSHGLNVSLTIPMHGDVDKNVQAAIDSAYRPNKEQNAMVTQIAVGNENLASCNHVPQQMFDVLYRLKASVPGHVKVGTVQRNTEYLVPDRLSMPGFKELLSACDFIGVNVHPVFTPNTRAESAIRTLDAQWKQLPTTSLSYQIPDFPSKLVLTEVGWPSGGYDGATKNWGSKEGAIRFLNDYYQWAKQNNMCNDCSYYFQMFDQPQRKDGPFEAHFGLSAFEGQYTMDR